MGQVKVAMWVTAVLMAASTPARAAWLYGVAPFEAGVHSNLYRIDTATGAATLVGSTGSDRFGGLASGASGTLYGYTPGALYTIDASSGAATRVGLLGTSAPEGGLAFEPSTGTLFGVSSEQDTLLRLDLATGAATTVGPLGAAGRDTSGLAFLPDGRLLGVALVGTADQLVEIDTATGAASTIGPTGTNIGLPSVAGLEFDPATAKLYFSDGAALYSVNPATGAATLIGAHGSSITTLAGLAATVPEPVTAAPLCAMLLLLARQRRRAPH